jgi:hypothetical protein
MLIPYNRTGRQGESVGALLSAYVELERWREASAFLASLSNEIRNRRLVQDLARRVERNEN